LVMRKQLERLQVKQTIQRLKLVMQVEELMS
jgi:hypothetical protein